jgi:hypothetical protein
MGKEITMAAHPFREALQEFRDEIARATRSIDDQALTTFIAFFEGDFAVMLSDADGEAVWRRDRQRLFYMGRVLGTFAEFVATAARGSKATVGLPDLKEALKAMRPHCRVPEQETDDGKRRKYCENVPL